MQSEVVAVIDTCDNGHKFAKLPDHPLKDGRPRCPHCMAVGLDRARTEKDKQLEAIRSIIDNGCDEVKVRRVWECALIEGNEP